MGIHPLAAALANSPPHTDNSSRALPVHRWKGMGAAAKAGAHPTSTNENVRWTANSTSQGYSMRKAAAKPKAAGSGLIRRSSRATTSMTEADKGGAGLRLRPQRSAPPTQQGLDDSLQLDEHIDRVILQRSKSADLGIGLGIGLADDEDADKLLERVLAGCVQERADDMSLPGVFADVGGADESDFLDDIDKFLEAAEVERSATKPAAVVQPPVVAGAIAALVSADDSTDDIDAMMEARRKQIAKNRAGKAKKIYKTAGRKINEKKVMRRVETGNVALSVLAPRPAQATANPVVQRERSRWRPRNRMLQAAMSAKDTLLNAMATPTKRARTAASPSSPTPTTTSATHKTTNKTTKGSTGTTASGLNWPTPAPSAPATVQKFDFDFDFLSDFPLPFQTTAANFKATATATTATCASNSTTTSTSTAPSATPAEAERAPFVFEFKGMSPIQAPKPPTPAPSAAAPASSSFAADTATKSASRSSAAPHAPSTPLCESIAAFSFDLESPSAFLSLEDQKEEKVPAAKLLVSTVEASGSASGSTPEAKPPTVMMNDSILDSPSNFLRALSLEPEPSIDELQAGLAASCTSPGPVLESHAAPMAPEEAAILPSVVAPAAVDDLDLDELALDDAMFSLDL